MLGRIVELVSGRELDAFIAERITSPLQIPQPALIPCWRQMRTLVYQAVMN